MADLVGAVSSGDLRAALEAQRDHLASALEACDPEKSAPLHARLTDVLVRLAALEAPKESKLDDLARKRAERRKRGA